MATRTSYNINDTSRIPYTNYPTYGIFDPDRPYYAPPMRNPYEEFKPHTKPQILATEVETSLQLTFVRHFDNNTSDRITISKGDIVTVQYIDVTKFGPITVVGKIDKIICSSSIAKKENLSIMIDASTDMNQKKIHIPMTEIISIDMVKDEDDDNVDGTETIPPASEDLPTPSPDEMPISWSLDNICVEGNLLKVPYARLKPGQVDLVISNRADGDIFFKERFVALAANPTASFTWSMRDFSTIPSLVENIPHDFLIEDGEYIYRNGDNVNEVIFNTDNNNDLIIPAGTELFISITYKDEDPDTEDVTISTLYTVTISDVQAVTS